MSFTQAFARTCCDLRVVVSVLCSLCLAAIAGAQETGRSQEAEGRTEEVRPVAVNEGVARLVPENTRVEFIGTHVGADKKPRLGGFQRFSGQLKMDGQTLTGVEIEFDIKSLWTEFGPLTKHLLNPDFFDSEKFGKASFASTEVVPGENSGEFLVKGNMTLMGAEAEISFPAKITATDDGILLTSKFQIDRTDFGMDKKTEGVDKEVTILVSVGHRSAPRKIGDVDN